MRPQLIWGRSPYSPEPEKQGVNINTFYDLTLSILLWNDFCLSKSRFAEAGGCNNDRLCSPLCLYSLWRWAIGLEPAENGRRDGLMFGAGSTEENPLLMGGVERPLWSIECVWKAGGRTCCPRTPPDRGVRIGCPDCVDWREFGLNGFEGYPETPWGLWGESSREGLNDIF